MGVGAGRDMFFCVVGQAQLPDGGESLFLNRMSGFPNFRTLPEIFQKHQLGRRHQDPSLTLPPLHSVCLYSSAFSCLCLGSLFASLLLSVCLSACLPVSICLSACACLSVCLCFTASVSTSTKTCGFSQRGLTTNPLNSEVIWALVT